MEEKLIANGKTNEKIEQQRAVLSELVQEKGLNDPIVKRLSVELDIEIAKCFKEE